MAAGLFVCSGQGYLPVMEKTYPFVIDTLGKMKLAGSRLSVNCNKCHKHTMLDMDDLIRRLGPDHGCMDPDLRHLFFCSDCRDEGRPDRNITFIHHANVTPHDNRKASNSTRSAARI